MSFKHNYLKGLIFLEYILVLCYIYSFLIGICVASFINVVIWRIPQGISIAKGRSFCPTCDHKLAWYDLFPIFSYLFLKGKCRYCGAKIPWRDTCIEVLGGLIGIWCFQHFQFSWDTLLVFSICMILLAVMMIDFDTMTIPNGLTLALLVPIIMMTILHPEISLWNRLIGFFVVSLPMYLLTLLIPDCFGGGDIKLIAVCGFLLGWQNTLLAGFISILLGGVYACYLLLSKKAKKGAHIAFGPYLIVGIIVSLFYGIVIIKTYLSFFGIG